MKRLFVLLLFSGCLSLGPSSEHDAIPGFYRVHDNLYRGGRPEEDGWKHLKTSGIKTVISLEEGDVSGEQETVKRLGMDFVSIPISLYQRPTDGKVIQFLSIVLDETKQPVFVHCDKGKDRTGAMIAVYRVIRNELGPRAAYQEAKRYGFWPYRGDAELKKFIHQLNDKKEMFEQSAVQLIGDSV